MAIPSGRAAFKKKDGVLTLRSDQQSVIWTPAPGDGPPTVSLALANITSKISMGGDDSFDRNLR